MNYGNLFIFVVTYFKQLNGESRAVIIVRNTPLSEITAHFDAFLSSDQIKPHFQFTKETDSEHPDMIIYHSVGSKDHIVFGLSEQGWKGDYGLTHNDFVVSIL